MVKLLLLKTKDIGNVELLQQLEQFVFCCLYFFAAYLYSMHEVNKYVNHPENYQVDTLMSNGQIKEIIVYRK